MAKDKAKSENNEQEKSQSELIDFNFPEYGRTIQAATIEEAEKKLFEDINK